MKYITIFLLLAGVALTACHKNNDPAPPVKNPTGGLTADADSAAGIVVITSTLSGERATNTLIFLNPDGSLRWKKDQFNGETLDAPSYENGILYISTGYFDFNPPGGGRYIMYGKIYAIDAADGSIKWSYCDSAQGGATRISNGELYFAQGGGVRIFDAKTGVLKSDIGIRDCQPWTPLVDMDTLYAYTDPFLTSYHKITAVDIKTGQPIWSTGMGIYPPRNLISTNGKLILTTIRGELMMLDKATGYTRWKINDLLFDDIPMVIGNTVFALNITQPLSLCAIDPSTGALQWKTNFVKAPQQYAGLYQYRNNIIFYAYDGSTSYLQTVNPRTGDSISRTTINEHYGSPILVGHRFYAKKTWDNTTNSSLAVPQVVILDADNLALKHSTAIDAMQIRFLRVIGKSGKFYQADSTRQAYPPSYGPPGRN